MWDATAHCHLDADTCCDRGCSHGPDDSGRYASAGYADFDPDGDSIPDADSDSRVGRAAEDGYCSR